MHEFLCESCIIDVAVHVVSHSSTDRPECSRCEIMVPDVNRARPLIGVGDGGAGGGGRARAPLKFGKNIFRAVIT